MDGLESNRVCGAITLLRRHGLRVAVVTTTDNAYEVDKPGKDSYELRKAGADEMLLASGHGWALMVEHEASSAPCLEALLSRIDGESLDVVVVIGFGQTTIQRLNSGNPTGVPRFSQSTWLSDIGDSQALADHILRVVAR
jgi:molybdopterin-guanine dinucleotide biosynthesis protein MobB